MEISGNYKNYSNDYLEVAQAPQAKIRESSYKQMEEEKNTGIPIPKDEYISSEKSGQKPSGLYHLGQDENGKPKVIYDAPKKAEKAAKSASEPPKTESAQKCTTNTDSVDREIEKLKEEKKQLEQQIKSAAGDQKKVKELKRKLAKVEGELGQKDNDMYRRQNSKVYLTT